MNPMIAALMFPAMFLLVFAGIPVAFSLIIPALVAGWFAFGPHLFDQLYGSLYSGATNYILSAIPMFVLMGAILERSGIAARLFRTMQLWLGRLPGGLAVATIAMGATFAAAAGVDPIWFGTMMIVVIQTSYLTPPMASSIFYLLSIAPPDMKYGQICKGVVPFILIQLLTLLLVALFPVLSTWLPQQIVGF